MSSLRCFLRWPPGHRYEVEDKDGQSVVRCTHCGKRKGGERGTVGLPSGGNPVGGPPMDH